MNNAFHLKDLRWFLSLGKKFVRVTPIRTLMVVLLTLVGQVAYILSFFLPLKIVILLGTDGIPRYFPASFAQFDRDLLIVYLSVATIGFFFLNVVTEKLTDYVSGGASASLMDRSQKLVLFEKQEEIAASAYQSFSRALAGLVFGTLTIFALSIVYSDMAWVMGCYLSLVVAVLLVLSTNSSKVRLFIQRKLGVLLNNLSAAGFFLVFGFLVLDFVLFEPPGIIFAVISILAGRQTFSRIVGAVKGLFSLYSQRQKLDVLFFHGRALAVSDNPRKSSLWAQLHPDTRKGWVREVLAEFQVDDPMLSGGDWSLVWHQPAIAHAGALIARVGEQQFLIKLYDRRRSVGPQHEATLLADAPAGLPAPMFVGASQVSGYPCSVFRLAAGRSETSEHTRKVDSSLLLEIYGVIPPSRLAQRFLRSKPTLAGRMQTDWLNQAAVAVTTAGQQQASLALGEHWRALHALIGEVPLALFNPATKASAVWVCDDGSKQAMFWERWSLEPIGAGWPTKVDRLRALESARDEIADHREDLVGVSAAQLKLVALLFEFERMLRKNKFDVAVRLLPHIWRTLAPLVELNAETALETSHGR